MEENNKRMVKERKRVFFFKHDKKLEMVNIMFVTFDSPVENKMFKLKIKLREKKTLI